MDVPMNVAKLGDARALAIFEQAARNGKPFKECLGEIYMIGIMAGASVKQPQQ